MGFLYAILGLLHLCLIADVCKRGDVTVQPSHVISLGSAVNISCSLKTKQGCLQFSSFNKLILYKFDRRIYFQHGRSLSSQVTGLPLGTTLFVCKLACSSNDEIRICGAEISVGEIVDASVTVGSIRRSREMVRSICPSAAQLGDAAGMLLVQRAQVVTTLSNGCSLNKFSTFEVVLLFIFKVVPEQPQNLSCIQKGERGTVGCTWDRGQDTHLYTAYTLQ
ncbi:hypothetical protein J1605_020752 [Eschrichtius robustus]|uniref:Immunoglobulin C2-set-like ligand-binding domain-containing protein n=1 Tax=Eschrichtius robustus TaxID=9764 RepID=A0AB34HI58_ESCRO|nr:hypothetical protein J1605_020752 [Eschrichtius robustus]